MNNLISQIYKTNRKQLLDIGKQGYESNGIGAVLFTVGDPRVIYARRATCPILCGRTNAACLTTRKRVAPPTTQQSKLYWSCLMTKRAWHK